MYHYVELSYANSLCPIKVQVFLVVITLSNDTRNAPTLQQFLFKLKNLFFSRLQYVFNTWVSNPDMPNLVKPI